MLLTALVAVLCGAENFDCVDGTETELVSLLLRLMPYQRLMHCQKWRGDSPDLSQVLLVGGRQRS
jgi:hypothetical protein